MAQDDEYTQTLRKAQLASGGISDLAARLKVSIYDLTVWIEGTARPPQDVYRAAQEIAKGYRSKL